jgi:hypothetical protein
MLLLESGFLRKIGKFGTVAAARNLAQSALSCLTGRLSVRDRVFFVRFLVTFVNCDVSYLR